MEKEMFQSTPKISIDIKQTSKGTLYIGSLKINADNVDELDDLLEQALYKIREKITNFNMPLQHERENIPKIDVIRLNPDETELFERLRKLRLEIAKKENFPPYVVFHDSVLKQFAKLKPETKEEMLRIEGVGEKRFEKYGNLFLTSIKEFVESAKPTP